MEWLWVAWAVSFALAVVAAFKSDMAQSSAQSSAQRAQRAQRRIDEWTDAMKGERSRLAANVHDLDKDVEYIESWLGSQGWGFRPAEETPARWVKAKKS